MSKNLDDELNDVARATEEDAPDGSAHDVVPPTPKPSSRAGLWLLIVLVVVGASVAGVVLMGVKEAAVYALTVDKLVERSGELTGRKVRVEGLLVPATLVKRDSPCEYRFTIQQKDVPLKVRYEKCEIPDTFRDRPEGGVEVTAEGKLNAQGEFDATLVMAKCTSKYDPNTHQVINPESVTQPAPSIAQDQLIR
jgi:cytochrome c-type biogenesis protein CcmE